MTLGQLGSSSCPPAPTGLWRWNTNTARRHMTHYAMQYVLCIRYSNSSDVPMPRSQWIAGALIIEYVTYRFSAYPVQCKLSWARHSGRLSLLSSAGREISSSCGRLTGATVCLHAAPLVQCKELVVTSYVLFQQRYNKLYLSASQNHGKLKLAPLHSKEVLS